MNKSILFLIVFLVPILLPAQRSTLWLKGLDPLSHGFGDGKTIFDQTFDFDDLMPSETQYQNGLNTGMSTASGAAGNFTANANDVLGIGHDFGGLVLRDLAAQTNNSNLSALILNGTPNRGSKVLRDIVSNNNGSFSFNAFIDRIDNITEADECELCGVLDGFRTWVGGLQMNAANINDILDNTQTDAPDIPFAVLWGNSDNSFSSFVSAQSSTNEYNVYNDNLGDCYQTQLDIAKKEAEHNYQIATINQVSGFLSGFLSALGTYLIGAGAPTPASIPGLVLNFIASGIATTSTQLTAQIDAQFDRDTELNRILRCRLGMEQLSLEWYQLITANSVIEIEESVTFEYDPDCYGECLIAEMSGIYDPLCYTYCEQDVVYEYSYFIFSENDGIYNEYEQTLDGAAGTYEMVNTNHFQETSVVNSQYMQFMTDLFNGGAGGAFSLP